MWSIKSWNMRKCQIFSRGCHLGLIFKNFKFKNFQRFSGSCIECHLVWKTFKISFKVFKPFHIPEFNFTGKNFYKSLRYCHDQKLSQKQKSGYSRSETIKIILYHRHAGFLSPKNLPFDWKKVMLALFQRSPIST